MSHEKVAATEISSCFTKSGFKSALTYLNGYTKLGNTQIYTTPFDGGSGYDPGKFKSLQQAWDKMLKQGLEKYPTLYDYETEMKEKAGPLSFQKPYSERRDDIANYYDCIELKSVPIDSDAIAKTISEFHGVYPLRPRSLYHTNEEMKKSTSSGPPFQTRKKRVQKETLSSELLFNPLRQKLRTGEEYQLKAILGWRGQEGGPKPDDVKQRVVWMFPYLINLHELSVYQPLIAACQRKELVAPWISMDLVDRRITQLFDTKAKDDLVICTDFSKFDQHFNAHMQEAARCILLGLGVPEIWLDTVFPIKYDIDLIAQVDTMWTGPHGMGSGSGGTNADETLTHRSLQHEVAMRHGTSLNPNSMCLGDDGVLSYPGITVEDVVESYSSHGQECNSDKQYASLSDCVFLRRWHSINYRINDVMVGVYPTHRALGRLKYLERWMDPDVWSAKAVALRELSILENCKFHPCKEEFVKFCMQRDKYRLGLDIPGFLDNIEAYAQEVRAYMPEFVGYTKSLGKADPSAGISKWWIVDYLKHFRK